VHLQPTVSTVPWAASKESGQQVELHSGESLPGVLHPALEPLAQEGRGPLGAGREEGDKNDQRDRTPLLRGKAERAGVVQPAEEKAPERPYSSLSVPEGGLQEGWGKSFSKACCDRTRCNGFKLREGRFQLDVKEEIFYNEGGETLEQISQRDSGGLIPGNIQGQVGWASEQPVLVENVPFHCRGFGLDDL